MSLMSMKQNRELMHKVVQQKLEEEMIDALLKYFPKGIISLDLETTGLSPLSDSIIELAAVKVTHDKKLESFSSLIKPNHQISAESTSIHGITNKDVENAPPISDILPLYNQFVGDLSLIHI